MQKQVIAKEMTWLRNIPTPQNVPLATYSDPLGDKHPARGAR